MLVKKIIRDSEIEKIRKEFVETLKKSVDEYEAQIDLTLMKLSSSSDAKTIISAWETIKELRKNPNLSISQLRQLAFHAAKAWAGIKLFTSDKSSAKKMLTIANNALSAGGEIEHRRLKEWD